MLCKKLRLLSMIECSLVFDDCSQLSFLEEKKVIPVNAPFCIICSRKVFLPGKNICITLSMI